MKEKITKVFFIEIGTLLFAIAVGMFLLPSNVLTGGIAGIVSLLEPFISIDADILVIIISTALFIVGCIMLGREFTVNTIVHSVSYPFMLLAVSRMLPKYEIDPILAAIYGGVIGGAGIGLIFRNGGSSGGADVPILIMEKYLGISASKGIMIMDAITVSAGLFIYGLNDVLIGLISVFFTSFTMERVINAYGGIEAKKVEIISDKYEMMIPRIHDELERGTTILHGKGGYTNDDKEVLMTVVFNNQLEDCKKIIRDIDPEAFVIITDATDVNGLGFTFEARL